jgi:hypothetical protein
MDNPEEKFWRKHLPTLVVLLAALGLRFFLARVLIPILHTDSVSFLFLSEVDMVRTPGYPLFIEGLLRLNDLFSFTTDYLQLICNVQVFLLGTLNAWLVYDITRTLTRSRWFGVGMSFVYNLNYFVIGFEFQIMTETLTVTLLLSLTAVLIRLFKERLVWAFLAGAVMVFLVYTRATYLLFWAALPVVILVGLWPDSKTRIFWRKCIPLVLTFMLISLLGILGWSLRNRVQYDYFGVSSLMPHNLRYYTNSLFPRYRPSGDVVQDGLARIYAEEYAKTAGSSVTYYNFQNRVHDELALSEGRTASAFLKVQLRLIGDFPGEYLRQVPASWDAYYRQYKAYWNAGNNKRFLMRPGLLPRVYRTVFNLYSSLFVRRGLLALMLLAAPLVVLVFSRRDGSAFFGWLLVLAVIHYTGFVSILSTNAGINNLRYRQPAEPLILLMFYAAVFYLGRAGFRLLRKSRSEPAEET